MQGPIHIPKVLVHIPGVGVGHYFVACVRRLEAMKNPYDETCRGQFVSRRFWFISRRFWPFQCFFFGPGLDFPSARTFFRGLRATVASHENHYDETCGSQFISRRFWFISQRFWPLNGSVLIQCGVRVCICGLQSRGGREASQNRNFPAVYSEVLYSWRRVL